MQESEPKFTFEATSTPPFIERASIDEIRSKIRNELDKARSNALDIEHDDVAIQDYADLCTQELLPLDKRPNTFSEERLKELEKLILSATAQVSTIVEFKLLLEEAGLHSGLVYEYVAHENAHANTALQYPNSITFNGYGLTYFSERGELKSVQPCIIEHRSDGATVLAYIDAKLKTLIAPDVYGETTSDDDKREVKMLTEIRNSNL